MKKLSAVSIVFAAVLIVVIGASVAYYNTKSFGFDEDTVLFLQEDDGFTFFDYKVYYKDVEELYESTKEYMPETAYSTDPRPVSFYNDFTSYLPISGS